MEQQRSVPSIEHPPLPSSPLRLPQPQSQPQAQPRPSLKSHRGASLPASIKTADLRSTRRRPTAIRIQAASPEVISSLIDQLAVGPVPLPNHFENLLPGYGSGPPVSPNPSIRTRSARNSHDDAPLEKSSFYHSVRHSNDLYPDDDACEPPVIRTSKPPSGLSLLTAPKKRNKPHSLSSYIGRSGGSSTSLHSSPSIRSISSIGNISVETAAPRPALSDSNRSSAESKRSTKPHRNLIYMGSRERLRQKEIERKRVTVHSTENSARTDAARTASPQQLSHQDTIKEEPCGKEDTLSLRSKSSLSTHGYPNTPRRIRLNFIDDRLAESSSGHTVVAGRGSSLTRSDSPTPGSGGGQANDLRQPKHKQAKVEREEDATKPPKLTFKEMLLQELEQDENSVAQRIRELKEQKIRRDEIAGKTLADKRDSGLSPLEFPRDSPLESPGKIPIPLTSPVLEEPFGPEVGKSRKARGTSGKKTTASTGLGKSGDRNEAREVKSMATTQWRSTRRAVHDKASINDGYDLNPLPINYALAVRRLKEPAPSSSSPRVPQANLSSPSDEAFSSSSSPSSRRKSSKDYVSKRPGSATCVENPTILRRSVTTPPAGNTRGDAPGHRHSSSATDTLFNMMGPILCSNSEDVADRHESTHARPLSASKSAQVQLRRTLTKKRWSQSDLPTETGSGQAPKGQRSGAKSASETVQASASPLPEERPASLNSIDLDVESYLSAPRLSQKVRHPQTGRIISFSEVGDPDGYAIFVCLGMGLTRYVMAFYDQLAATLKLRLITPERPGIGESEADPHGTPLSWPDDVLVICQALNVTKFSLLAHSAGTVYALATSLRMSPHIRGRVHLLAPWIPPSQMAPAGANQKSPPTQQLPRAQRFLRALPPSILRVANSTFLSGNGSSLQRNSPKMLPKSKRKSMTPQPVHAPRPSLKDSNRQSMMLMDQVQPRASPLTLTSSMDLSLEAQRAQEALTIAERQRQHAFDERLTFAIWNRATHNANPAADLIVCLETKQSVGFRYEDISRPIVVHHGSKDTRVPVDNVRWLGRLMRKCEIRILEGENHSLMASAHVMGNVLTEMASEWDDWTSIVTQKPMTGDLRTVSSFKAMTERSKSPISLGT